MGLCGGGEEMSAIAGLWRLDGSDRLDDDCQRMLRALTCYGPDHGAHWHDDRVAMGRRLYRLLDEDRFDRQVQVGGGGRFVLVGDMRLGNRDELAQALAIDPDRAGGMCDAALVLAAWERWDLECCDHLLGDWAFALWDRAERRLVLARDALGMRPLYFHRGADFFAFATMAKGMHALADIPYAADQAHMAGFVALTPEVGSRTFFAGIERVPPGHLVVISDGRVVIRPWWRPDLSPMPAPRGQELIEAMREQLDVAVGRCLRGVREVAAHLSAGLDSSGVVATAARHLAAKGGKVVAFTATPRPGYDGAVPSGRIGDEGPLAAATAALYPNVEHVPIPTDGRSPLADLDRYFHLFERPMLNLCNGIWINAINDAARARRLSVLLTGQMGNMTLSYAGGEALAETMLAGKWRRWWQIARGSVRTGWRKPKGVVVASLGPFCPPGLWLWLNRVLMGRSLNDIRAYAALAPAQLANLADIANHDVTFRPWANGARMRLWALGRVDSGFYHKGVLAGWGLDQRDPTADRHLVEFCLRLPAEAFIGPDAIHRWLGRQVLADRLPPEVTGCTRKGWQLVDWHEPLTAARDAVAAELDRQAACPDVGAVVDMARLRRLTEDWPTGGWASEKVIASYRLALLRGLSAGHFLRRASGSNQ